MKRKLWVLFLGFALFFVPLGPVAGQAKPDQPSKLTEQIAKIKAAISKRVTDDKARVKIQLRDGSEMKGRLNQAGNDDFTLTNEKSGQQMTLAYADVQRVKGRGLKHRQEDRYNCRHRSGRRGHRWDCSRSQL